MDKTFEDIFRTVGNTQIMCGTSLPGTTEKNRLPTREEEGWLAEGHTRITALIQG